MIERQTFWVDFAAKREGTVKGDVYDQRPVAVEPAEANLVSSALVTPTRLLDIGYAPTHYDARHAVALDLDVPARLVPSSTPGHSHLYIDVPMDWADYVTLLRLLAKVGIIEQKYAEASIRQGATYLRPEGVEKGVNDAKPKPRILREAESARASIQKELTT